MKHLLLPAQVEKGCFRQRFTEYVRVPLKHKKSINSLLSVFCMLVDVCDAALNESKWKENGHLWAYPLYIVVSARVKIQQEETPLSFNSGCNCVSSAPLWLQMK